MGMEPRAPCKHIYCPYEHPQTLVPGQNVFFLSERGHVAYQIKGNEHRVPCKLIFYPYTHPRPLGWGQRSKHFFSEISHVAYQINGNEEWSTMQANILSLHTPSIHGEWSKGQF